MSKVEQRAWEAFPDYKIIDGKYVMQKNERSAYKAGYHQAEKDLELTWEDIKTIDKLLNQCVDYSNPYQEVLKRFKEIKK